MAFRTSSVSFRQTGLFSNLFLDFNERKKILLKFCNHFPDIQSILQYSHDFSISAQHRKILYETLKEQYSGLPLHSKLGNNLRLLENENTYTVCTGHQLCLFTGPSYFFYKIISCIQLCEELNKISTKDKFIPVFWMASEDHDILEINHTYVFGKRIEWASADSGKAGKLKLDGLSDAISQLEEVLGNNPFTQEIIFKLKSYLSSSSNLSEFTRKMVNEIFGRYGLIILDPDEKNLKKLFIPQLELEFFGNASHNSVHSTSDELKENGYHAQVNAREINLFYAKGEIRERIILRNQKFEVNNSVISWTAEQLREAISNEPENFSPNVVLRPIYQQIILPNVAYVGGPAEISYWLQYNQLFNERKIPFPFLIPRRFITILEKNYLEKWMAFGFEISDFFDHPDSLIKRYISAESSEIKLQDQINKVEQIFDEITSLTSGLDQGFHTYLKAERQKVINSISAVEGKILKSHRQKNEYSISKIKSLREKVLPNGSLQERNENFFSFISKFGFTYIDQVLESTSKKSLTEENDLICLII